VILDVRPQWGSIQFQATCLDIEALEPLRTSPHQLGTDVLTVVPMCRRSTETGDACMGRSRSSRKQSELSLVHSSFVVSVVHHGSELKLGMPVWAEVGPRESRVNSPRSSASHLLSSAAFCSVAHCRALPEYVHIEHS